MSLLNAHTKEDIMEAFEEIEEYIEEEDNEQHQSAWAWGSSLLIHAIVLLIIGTILITKKLELEVAAINVVHLDLPEKQQEPEKRDLIEKPIVTIEHTHEVTDDITVITDIEFEPIEDPQTEDELDMNSMKGREDAMSNIEMASTMAFRTIGAGGGGSGAFGRTQGGDRKRMKSYYGPNARATENMLEAALRWLAIHQSPNGQWDSDNYFAHCQDNPKCEPGKHCTGADEAMTGYAVLCFLGMGYDHRHISRWRKTVKGGIDWIVTHQQADGLIGKRNYEHAVCTMALAEAYGMAQDPRLREPAQKAVNVILQRQTKDNDTYPLGWDYIQPNQNRMDSSVTGWNVMALKSAKASGLDVGDGIEGSKRWLKGAWKAANKNWENLTPYDSTVFPYTWNVSNQTKRDHLSFVGTLCGVFLGYQNGDIILDTMINDMNTRWYDNGKYKGNSYCLYYSSLSAFQYGGATWKEKWGNFDTGFIPWLIETQYKTEDCKNGTWEHKEKGWHGHDTSPVLIHCYKLLAAEVAFRYLPVLKKKL
jgi:hypothetical protein